MDNLLNAGFLVRDALRIVSLNEERIRISGKLHCLHNLVLHVNKTLQVDGNRARTIDYHYHAAFADPHRQIFRYDNAHEYREMKDRHHLHRFDPPGSNDGQVEWVGHDRWPSLFQVVLELERWWSDKGQHLDMHALPVTEDEPDSF